MVVENENVGWTWAICTKCGEMYQYYDKKGIYNDDFPRIMCPKCKAKAKKKKTERIRKDGTPEMFLKAQGIKDKDIIKEFKAIYNRNTRRRYPTILKDAIEIVGYRKEEKNGK